MAMQFRRGSAAIQEAATSKGGERRSFLPTLTWRNDGDSKYVLVLTDMEDVATLLLHSFIPVGKGKKANGDEFVRYEEFLSRKDVALGEDRDDLEDRLEREPKTRCMGVMVELEPVLEAGTKKLKGFVAKTETFTRNTDDGEIEVTAPVIGLCTQSAVTLWGAIDTLYQSLGDLIEVPVQITRRGKDKNTRYDTIPFMEKPVDLSPIIEYLDGINYIGDDLDEVIGLIEAADSEQAKTQAVADFLLNKRLQELADPQRYKDLVGPLTIEDFPKSPWGRKQQSQKSARQGRPARRSPREAVAEEAVETVESVEEAKPSKTDRFAALKSRVEARS